MIKRLNIYILGFSIIAFCYLNNSCTKDLQYKTLTFFFDGVPDTVGTFLKVDSNIVINDTSVLLMQEIADLTQTKYIHPPYQGQCESCHENGMLIMSQPELCYQCHDDFASKYTNLHGPVLGGYCSECHYPHKGERKLLKRKGQDLCFYCHEKDQVFINEIHYEIGETNCLECHNPHGGSDRFMFN